MREPYEIEERFDVPVLGRIPRRGRSEESRAAFAEAFRILRVSFGHVSPPDRDGTVAITSASAGEGKSTITHGLALAASEAGQSVLVIEADVHRMSQRRLFRVDIAPNAPGFVDALVGEAALEDVIYPTPVPGVKLIPAGLRQMSLSSTLEGSRAAETLGALSGLADLVLLDCPPLTAGADASVLASGASAVILVMRLRQTSRPEIIQALRRLERVDARVIGSVVNADRTLPIDPYGYAEDQLGGQSPKRRADARRKSTASLLEEFGG
jgi:capsular exopolysaccharide synthesis family protein